MKIFVSTALGLDVEDGAGVAIGSDIAASRERMNYGKMILWNWKSRALSLSLVLEIDAPYRAVSIV
jgi:hypothetical protein